MPRKFLCILGYTKLISLSELPGYMLTLFTFMCRPILKISKTVVQCPLLYAVCGTAGYLMSYWNRAFFPVACADDSMSDKTAYDTVTRIAGSAAQVALAFKEVIDMYGWTHVVLLTDEDNLSVCWHVSQPVDALIGHHENYTMTWLRLGSNPTDEQLDHVLQHMRSHARGSYFVQFIYILAIFVIVRLISPSCFRDHSEMKPQIPRMRSEKTPLALTIETSFLSSGCLT